jgi:hypothetical protein
VEFDSIETKKRIWLYDQKWNSVSKLKALSNCDSIKTGQNLRSSDEIETLKNY